MKIVKPHAEILGAVNGADILRHIELCGRVCYKSEDRITDTSGALCYHGQVHGGPGRFS